MIRSILSRLPLIWTSCVFADPALACDGPDPGPLRDRYRNADIVAIVRVTSLRAAPGKHEVEGEAKVLELLKGPPVSTISVRGYTPYVDCWSAIDVGREYVVFTSKSGPHQGRAEFGMFSASIDAAQVDRQILKTWRLKAKTRSAGNPHRAVRGLRIRPQPDP